MRKSKIEYGRTVAKCMSLIKAGTPIICFDLETTGLSSIEDRIISFSAIKSRYVNGIFEEVEQINLFINPERPIPPSITSINHITDEKVKDCPTEDTAVKKIKEFMGESPLICGYNSTRFDEKFIKNMYQRTLGEDFSPILHVDVMSMAKEKIENPSHHLSDIAHLMGVDQNLEFHNSLDDVLATFWIFRMLIPEYDENEDEKPLYKIIVKGANWYERSHRVRRVYISTVPYTKTYYDAYKGEWNSDTDGFDIKKMINDVFSMYQVSDEKELVKTMSLLSKKKAAQA